VRRPPVQRSSGSMSPNIQVRNQNVMLKNRKPRGLPPVIVVLLGLCAMPGVAAERVCFTAINGTLQCSSILPYSAKVAIWCSILGVIGLILCVYIFISCRQSRRRAAIYHVEANQIHGPSLGAPFDPRTATLSATYPKTPEIVISPAPPRGTPNSSHFATAQQENLAREIVNGWPRSRPPQTAPVSKPGTYPFAGHSPKAAAQQPRTAFQSGFPRPLYSGRSQREGREVHKDWV